MEVPGRGTPAHLIDDETEIDPAWLGAADTVGVTSGASAPEWLVERVVGHLRSLGAEEVEEFLALFLLLPSAPTR